jgi:hypothetical protein
MWYVVKHTGGDGAAALLRLSGFGSYGTAWAWLQKLRRAMKPTSGRLHGEVEVDEALIRGVEERGKGRETNATVIIPVERRGQRMVAGRVRTRRIDNFKTETLTGFIEGVVEPAAVIVHRQTPAIPLPAEPRLHHVRHVMKGSGKQAHELMPAVHRVSALVKRWLLAGTPRSRVPA